MRKDINKMWKIQILGLLGGVCILYLAWRLFNEIIFPKMVRNGMKEIERNPKWILSQLHYYGFSDIDIILCESKWGMLPRFRLGKNHNLELWIDYDTSTKDVEEVGRLALAGKVRVKYGLWFPEKPLYWLSILCYMLDGGDIQMSNVSWEEAHKKEKE
jgi:hypothetical protein